MILMNSNLLEMLRLIKMSCLLHLFILILILVLILVLILALILVLILVHLRILLLLLLLVWIVTSERILILIKITILLSISNLLDVFSHIIDLIVHITLISWATTLWSELITLHLLQINWNVYFNIKIFNYNKYCVK